MKYSVAIFLSLVGVFPLRAESVSAWEGLQTRSLTAEERENLPQTAGAGLWVVSVPNAGPVTEGLQRGDVLFRFGEQILVHPDQVPLLLRLAKDAGEVDVVFYRKGEETLQKIPVLWDSKPVDEPEIIESVRGIPLDRAQRTGSRDPLEEREAKSLERIRQQVDQTMGFGGSLSSPPLRRGERADDE